MGWTLFTAAGSCAQAVHIALHEAEADFRVNVLDLAQGDQRRPGYLLVNPQGRVPALVTEQGVLTETPALLAFVAQRFPKAALAPLDDPMAFARLQAFNSYLSSTVHVAHAHKRRGALLGRRRGGHRRHATQGGVQHGRCLRPDRGRLA